MERDEAHDDVSDLAEQQSGDLRDAIPGTKTPLTAGRLAGSAVAVLLLVGMAAVGIALLQWRAEAEGPEGRHPAISVATVVADIQKSYRTTTRHVGRLEVARQSALAFERGGLVIAVKRDEGAAVKAGEVIARLDDSRLQSGRRQLMARQRELDARRVLARLTLDRQAKLQARGWSPDQRLDEAQAGLAQLDAAIEQVKAEIVALDIDIAKSRISAPFDGTISARMVDEGSVVAAATPVVSLMETGRRRARIGLPPQVASDLDPAASFSFESPGGRVEGWLAARRPDLQAQTQTVTVLFELDGASSIPIGEVVALVLNKTIKERGVWLPLTALKEGRKGLWSVLAVRGDGSDRHVAAEAVEILYADGNRVFVRGTFGSGARIISEGTDRVVVGQRVALSGQ